VATEIAILNRGYLLVHMTPEELLQQVEGKVWEWVVSSTELTAIRQRYLVSSTARRSDGVHVRLVSDHAPAKDASAGSPLLEDAYLYCLSRSRQEGMT
jgi:ABC-2 type transport system ATP-binding protein